MGLSPPPGLGAGRPGMGWGFSLSADDGTIWKRGKNIQIIVKKIAGSYHKKDEQSYRGGVKFSVDKTKVVFTRKRSKCNLKLKHYNQELERKTNMEEKFLMNVKEFLMINSKWMGCRQNHTDEDLRWIK